MLSVDELPGSIKSIQIEYLQLETKIITIVNDDPFLRNTADLDSGTLFLFFMDGCRTALKTYSHFIYWFDLHCRDERGSSVVCEMPALLKCRNLREVKKYIQVTYLE